MKTYKILQGGYNQIYETEIHLPEDLKFIYRDGDCGNVCHIGHNHYLGMMKYDKDIRKEIVNLNGVGVTTYEFGDELMIILLRDIKPIDELPLYNSYKEFMDEFELDKYYIIQSKKDMFDEEKFKELYNRKPTILDWVNVDIGDFLIKGKQFEISKIISVEGPYAVTVFSIMNGNYFDDRPTYSMMLHGGIELTHIINDLTNNSVVTVKKHQEDLFEEMKNNVLKQIK
jgi:hypothetical protein